MHPIDVHIIEHPLHDRSEARAALLEQLAAEPVNVHIVKGHPRHIGRGRHDGFRQGSAPWCSYVDDDDMIEPGIYRKMLDLVERDNRLSGVCTRECIVHPDGTHQIKEFMRTYYDKRDLYSIHHLPLFRRDAIEHHLPKLLDLPDGSEHSLWAYVLLDGGIVQHLPEVGYYWKQHEGNSPHLGIPVPACVGELHRHLMAVAASEMYAPNAPENPPLINNYSFVVA